VNVFALCLNGAHVGSLTLVTGYLSGSGWSPLGAAAAYAPMGIFMGLMPFMAPVIRRYGAWRVLGNEGRPRALSYARNTLRRSMFLVA
jgi:hypothetical protein